LLVIKKRKDNRILHVYVLVRVEFPDYTGDKVETAADNTYL